MNSMRALPESCASPCCEAAVRKDAITSRTRPNTIGVRSRREEEARLATAPMIIWRSSGRQRRMRSVTDAFEGGVLVDAVGGFGREEAECADVDARGNGSRLGRGARLN